MTKDEARLLAWQKGALKWLLYKHQMPIYDKIREVLASTDPKVNSYIIDCARQFGKSFIMFVIAVEECIRNPGSTQVYIGPLKSQVNEIINGNTFGVVFATCPKDGVPSYNESALHFPNGSRIRIAGSDNRNYENLRGGAANTIFLDEAGFINDLTTGVLPTVEPMTKTTGGKVIFASTPPESLDHDYYDVLRDHDEQKLISTYTIWDDKSLKPTQLEKIINQCRGQQTTKFKREYECKRIAETDTQVLPELTKDVAASILLPDESFRQDPLYKHWIKYVVADWGGRDKTAILFAHFNTHKRKLIIEDHLDLVGSDISSARIAGAIKDKVKLLWTEGTIRYFCDNNNILIQNDMIIQHRLPFVATSKGKLHEMVQKVRDWVYDERIEFAGPAEFALKSCMSGYWNKRREEFATSKTYGHFDHLAALVYLVRNCDTTTDPVPNLLGFNKLTQFNSPVPEDIQKAKQSLSSVFYNPRRGIS